MRTSRSRMPGSPGNLGPAPIEEPHRRRARGALVALAAVAALPGAARADGMFLSAGIWGGGTTAMPAPRAAAAWLDFDGWAVIGNRGARPGTAAGLRAQIQLAEPDGANTFGLELLGGIGGLGRYQEGVGLFVMHAHLRYVHDVFHEDALRSLVGLGAGAKMRFTSTPGIIGGVALTVYRGAEDTTAGVEVEFGTTAGPLYLSTLLRADGAWGAMAGVGVGIAVGGGNM